MHRGGVDTLQHVEECTGAGGRGVGTPPLNSEVMGAGQPPAAPPPYVGVYGMYFVCMLIMLIIDLITLMYYLIMLIYYLIILIYV